MPNTNFQTFHQMGQAINEMVKQATGRDRVQKIDMDHVTVAQSNYYEEVTASGSMVSFTDRVGNTPLEKCVVQIEPVQEGSGNPSPDNIRPITGWPGVRIVVSPTTDAADGHTYDIAFPTEAETVYGGTLDVTTGVLTVDRVMYKFTGNESQYVQQTSRVAIKLPFNSASVEAGWCSDFAIVGTSVYDFVYIETALMADELKEYMQTHDVYAVLYIETPQTYQLIPQEVRTLLGQNVIWADTGDIEVKYKVLKEMY